MKKGTPFMLQIPMLRTAKIVAGKTIQVPGADPFTVHSIASIEFDGTRTTIIGYAAKEEPSEKR